MGFYIPSFIQKRILRYALSKFDLLDIDALGLESLDVAWGKRSTLELRDVGLRQDKLAALISLPEIVTIQDAKIRLLRLTIPADIHASGILFEAEGLHVNLAVPARDLVPSRSRSRQKTKRARPGPHENRSTEEAGSSRPHPAEVGSAQSHESTIASDGLPTAADLAQSFVDTEPAEEKAQLRAAVANARKLDESLLSESLEVDGEEGYGTPLSLPGFVADFLQGVQARAEVRVKDVRIEICLKLDLSAFNSQSLLREAVEDVRLRICLASLEVHPVSAEVKSESLPVEGSNIPDVNITSDGKRCVRMTGIQAIFLSDASIISFLAQFSGPPSPTATHVSSFKTISRTNSANDSSPTRASEAGRDIEQPDVAFKPLDVPNRPDLQVAMEESIGTSDLKDPSTSLQPSLRESLRSDLESDPDDDLTSAMSRSYHEAKLGDSRTSTQPAFDSPLLSLRGSFPPFEPYSSEDELFESRLAEEPHSEDADSGDSSPGSDLYHSLPAIRQPTADAGEDLTVSRIFSHEEASSMYQSAISQIESAGAQVSPRSTDEDTTGPRETIVGSSNKAATHDDIVDTAREDNSNDTPIQSVLDASRPADGPDLATASTMGPVIDLPNDAKADIAKSDAESFNSESLLPSKSQTSIAKPFFTVDRIDIELEAPGSARPLSEVPRNFQPIANSDETHVPGGFSTSTVSLADSRMINSQHHSHPAEKTADHAAQASITRVAVGTSRIAFDMTLIRIATMIWQQFSPQTSHQAPTGSNNQSASEPNLEVTLTHLSIKFVADLKEVLHDSERASLGPSPQELEVLLEVIIKRLKYSQSSAAAVLQRQIRVGTFTFGYHAEPIVAFDSSLKLRESVRDTLNPTGYDIKIDISSKPQRATEVTIMTLPLHIQLNLMRLDDTFGWIGGLSGILELGNSVISNTTITESSSPNSRRTKSGKRRNVRFVGSGTTGALPERTSDTPPSKVTARIGGLAFDLIGSKSSITVDGTAVKIAQRGEAIRFTVDRLSVKGPIVPGQDETAVSLELSLLKFVFLQSPQEDDLDRLLALLAPSHGYNESTGDIILETFLRQRRQGSILRVNVEKCSAYMKRTSDLEHFSVLLTDLKKLAPVARYIPDDNRPGLLTLARIEQASLKIETNHALGLINVHAEGSEIGHVSLPSILLLGINFITTHQGGNDLLGAVVDYKLAKDGSSESANPHAVHIRLIGDELEPTLKIKLWNVRFEYHISTVMSLLGLHETASGEVVVTELVNSVATLTSEKSKSQIPTQSSGIGSESTHPMKLEISIWDSAIGLNPRNSRARGLLHLTAISFLGNLPDEHSGTFDSTLTINKMSLLLVDDAQNMVSLTTDERHRQDSEGLDNAQLTLLKSSGYVVVSEISTASIAVQMVSSRSEEPSSVEVTIRDDLIVVETCADSTQTLIAVMNGLQPPMPPKKDLKYRTEIIPVQDMLASLSGQDFAVQDDEENDVDYSTTLDEPYVMDGDESADLEYDSRFYIPTGDKNESHFEDESNVPHSASASEHRPKRRTTSSFNDQLQSAPDDEDLQFDESHFANTDANAMSTRQWNSKKNTYELVAKGRPSPYPFRLSLKEVHLIWNLFDGYDWQKTRDAISQAVAEVETKAADLQARRKRRSVSEEEEEEPIIEDFLFNSIYIGVGTNQNPRELARNINRNIDDLISEAESYATSSKRSISSSPTRQGVPRARKARLRLQRSRHHKMTFELKGLNAEVLTMPPGSGETQSSVEVRVRDLDIFDHVPTSTWKKFATYMHDAGERESGTSMVHLEILNVKPVPDLAASEIIFKAHVLPLRLHVDQDALDFLTRFFEFKDESGGPTEAPSEPPFIQRAEVNSIPVKLDFKPKRVDYAGLRSGRTTEFMNFMILDAADMVLRHVIIYGVSGFDRLGKTLNDIWMPDVKRNQLPGVLAGLAPVRPLVNVGAGVRDLVVIPMREYRKDGRVLRSIQKGAFAFAKTTTTELAKLGAKVAMGTHNALQSAEGALVTRSPTSLSSPGTPTLPNEDLEERATISPYAELPVGVVQGLRGAYRQLERDLLLARDAIVAMPGEVLESGSATGAARAIARGAPTVVLRPALGVTKAMGQTLMGAATTMDRDERRRLEEKYKRH